MVEDSTAGDNFSLPKLQARFLINAPKEVQCKAIMQISQNLLTSEPEVDDWCAKETVKYYIEQLVEEETMEPDQVIEGAILDSVTSFVLFFYLHGSLYLLTLH
jgi:hypothetical protein